MAYSPTNWVEGVTTLGPTNLNKIEAELARLKTTSDLSATAGILGTQLAAAANVLGSQVQFSAGTSPPASPATGDLWYYQDVANGIYWLFRYNSSQTTYKWEFIGGSQTFALVQASETTTSVQPTFVDLATVGPSFTLPRAGDYDVWWTGRGIHSAGGSAIILRLMQNAAGVQDAYLGTPTASVEGSSPFGYARVSGAAANDVLKIKYAVNSAGTGTFLQRQLEVRPVRVI